MSIKRITITGGAGYVGVELVNKLLNHGYHVTVIDLMIYGIDVFNDQKSNPNLVLITGDIRSKDMLKQSLINCDAVIHLACISNDPSFELNPTLGKSINYDAFLLLVDEAKKANVKRFIYASSSSVYGIKSDPYVTESLPLEPLTDYSKYKAMCEEVLINACSENFIGLVVRPATVCGYSRRQRLDLTVNILTNLAYHNRKITVFGGNQMRPNIHIKDMVNFYLKALNWTDEQINKKIYNVGYENHRVCDIANMVQSQIGDDVQIITTPSDDQRSYHISSKKIELELGFVPKFNIKDAISDLKEAFKNKQLPNSFQDENYFNIKKMQLLQLT